MILKTTRLLLRPWTEADAESLYKYAKNPLIGPAAGWPMHTSVDNSRQIIRDILSAEETYAVTRKDTDRAIGSVGLLLGDKSNLAIAADEAEIGYWIGEPYWGQGFIPEAVREIMRHAFEDLGVPTLWCGYFDGNGKSKRVSEKCGFTFHHTEYDKEWPLIGAVKTQHVTRLARTEFHTAIHPAAENLRRNLLRFCDAAQAEAIAFPLHAAASDAEKAAWVRRITSTLKERFSPDAIRTVMMGCHCEDLCRLGEMKKWLGGLYRESSSLADFVERVNAHGAGWTLEDGAIHTKFLSCECHMLRDVDALDSRAWCHCTEGYTKALFEHVFGCEVESELVQTIKTGYDCCIVKILPKWGNIRRTA